MLDEDPVVRMRSADALEKVSAKHPEYLQPFKRRLINEISKVNQQEVRWHTAQMFSYIEVTKNERDMIMEILFHWLESEKSNIVRVFSMQTLANFARDDEKVKGKVVGKIRKVMKDGSPSLVSRGRKLLKTLEG